jgi:serine/threonine-protein kinase
VALAPGTPLGAYEILSLIGSGGMGEVYRAKDTKLGREIALKILPATFTNDPDRVARFRREAHVLASLNHPHIAQIHGLDDANGSQFLVLELVDGESLDKRIARGRIPVDEALGIAKQVAEALEAAHERGIIHRDLKPANIALTRDGIVKVLDFGLAKAVEPPGSASVEAMNSPTITTPAMMTGVGVILGTAAYMSPEQAKGRPADKRSDVWAFGCVLYEMVTGTRAFAGDDVSDVVASVLARDVDWRRLPSDISPVLGTYIRRCLVKDPRQRIRDVGDVRLALEGAFDGDARGTATTSGPVPLPSPWSRARPWVVSGLISAAVAALVILWPRSMPTPATIRMSTAPGTDATVAEPTLDVSALSPDGATFAFVGMRGTTGNPQIFVRRLDELRATPLPGTDDAHGPFFSPDGRWLAFFAGGKLKKVAVGGGAVVTIANALNARGGTWTDDGSIVFAAETFGVLSRVSSGGGNPEPATTLAAGETSHRWPQALGTRAVLYTASDSPASWSTANLIVQQVPLGSRAIVQKRGHYGRYLANGYLVFIRDGILFGAPFDTARQQFKTAPVPIAEGIASNARTGSAQYAFSRNGTFVYLPGASVGPATEVVWINKAGQASPLRAVASDWSNPHFSPDGSKLAMDIFDGTNIDVWVYDWGRNALSRLTFDAGADQKPVWTPDGRRITFSSSRGDTSTSNLYWQRADGAGDAQRLTESRNQQFAGSWHPSGKYLAFSERRPDTGDDLLIMPMEGDSASGSKPGTPTVFLATPAAETEPMFSPDGRWIAYVSNESGTSQVYVRPFPGAGGKWQVSSTGGSDPTWSRTRPELLYRSLAGAVMVVPYKVEGDSFLADQARPWSDFFLPSRPRQRVFDLHPDGERIGASVTSTPSAQDKVVFVFNFFDELRRITPSGKQ